LCYIEGMDAVIIVNPKSGRGLTQQQWASITAKLNSILGSFDVRFTESRNDAIRIASEEAAAGRELIIAFGGDGTISEVVNGLMQNIASGSQVGILPHGTGGDFRRTLGLPNSLEKVAERLRDSRTQKVDVGKVTFNDNDGKKRERYFINISSFGMSGHVARRANESSKTFGGHITFAAATIRTGLSFTNPEVFIQIDDLEPQRLRITNVCIANGRYFGGGMKVAPQASLTDGLFDVVMIGALSMTEMVTKGYRIYAGTHLDLANVGFSHGKRVKAWAADPATQISIEVDGETPGHLPVEYEIVPAAINLRI